MSEKLSRRTLFGAAGTVIGVLGTAGLAGCYPPPPPPPPPGGPPPGYGAEGPPEGYGQDQSPPSDYEEGPPSEYGAQERGQQGYGARYGKEPKRVAMYQDHPNGRQHCGLCEHFRPPDHCEIVRGRISPDGWCRHFHRRA